MNVFHSPNTAALKAVNMLPLQTETDSLTVELSSPAFTKMSLFFFFFFWSQLNCVGWFISSHITSNWIQWHTEVPKYPVIKALNLSQSQCTWFFVSSVDRPALADNGRSGRVGRCWDLFFSFYLFILSIQYSCPWNSWASFWNQFIGFFPPARTGVASFQ